MPIKLRKRNDQVVFKLSALYKRDAATPAPPSSKYLETNNILTKQFKLIYRFYELNLKKMFTACNYQFYTEKNSKRNSKTKEAYKANSPF